MACFRQGPNVRARPFLREEDRQGGLSHRARERLQAWVQLAPLDTDGGAMQSYMEQCAWGMADKELWHEDSMLMGHWFG